LDLEVIHSYAGGKIEDTGPLTKRMETIDVEVTDRTLNLWKNLKEEPFFIWYNTTAAH
jgi:arylsulfatase